MTLKTFWTSKCLNSAFEARCADCDVRRKLEEFAIESGRRVSEEIAQLRFDFHHDKRYCKLIQIGGMLDKIKEMQQAKKQ